MMKLLQDYKDKKRQKQGSLRAMEDEITRSFNRNDYVDDEEEEDAQLGHARYRSLEQHRLRAVEVELEKNRTRMKQSKVNSSRLKAAKNKMIKAFGSWVIDTNVPFTVVDSIYTNMLHETIREVSPDRDTFRLRAVTVGAEVEEVEETEVQMGWVLPIPLDHQQIIDRGRGVTVKDDRRSRRSPDEQPRESTQTYHCVRKAKEPIQPHGYPTDAMYGYAGGYDTYGGALNNYGYSSTNTNYPPPPYPSQEPQFTGSDSSRPHRDNPPIINQGTINYGDHYYHQPTFYSSNSTSSEQSWMDSTASSIFYIQRESYGVDQNNDDTYQNPPHHSFWW
ncbi:hypothetical protein Cgig2_021334 [Carnegiea gigantea]|uniref:Uncharacterized protein n=1 Tax=Carnegiea gigantea TaxID=171969 RepID=A0A9Q1GWU4_9CARY|nr:hypothetical protein Cgig2_021334 [Carnegiea gigantea]